MHQNTSKQRFYYRLAYISVYSVLDCHDLYLSDIYSLSQVSVVEAVDNIKQSLKKINSENKDHAEKAQQLHNVNSKYININYDGSQRSIQVPGQYIENYFVMTCSFGLDVDFVFNSR